MKQERFYIVQTETTLLPFLLEHMKGLSRNSVKNLLPRRQVLVDGQPVTRHDYPLKPGTRVELLAAGTKAPPFPILYEDDNLLVIDKPAGLLAVASDREKNRTAYRAVSDYMKGKGGRVFVIHRLDKDTSGVLLFAKSEKVKRAYQDNWDSLVRERAYLALVEGSPKSAEGTIHSWLKETETHLVYSTDHPAGNAKEAVTHYRVLAQKGAFSLLAVSLDTGRKNQIRVHMKDLGTPVTGDKKYGAGANPLGRLGLHAHVVRVIDPFTQKEMTFTAPPPKGFRV